ncbi:MAG: D-alanine--D-alanine ligase [Candidatus Aegiribacteria sp.]|nr:D-alanine--D-alanine ligase [Candidatus Aegiribacteria sp.]
MKILLISGGKSAEREVSIVSASFVRSILEESGHEVIPVEISSDGRWSLEDDSLEIHTGYPVWKLFRGDSRIAFDIVFPVLHGPWGEDGTVQGLCKMAGWPCAGADVMTSAVAMNKITTKELVSSRGIPVVPWKSFSVQSPPTPAALASLRYPLFVKPARMGSSVGISKIDSPEMLQDAADIAFKFDSLILIESGIEKAREIEVALLSESGIVSSSVAGEILPGRQWYDYTAKYNCEDSKLLIPAPIPETLSMEIRSCAEECFSILNGSGFARADFLLDNNGKYYFNELNTIPGFTDISMFPLLWNATGLSSAEVMNRILREAARKHSSTETSQG